MERKNQKVGRNEVRLIWMGEYFFECFYIYINFGILNYVNKQDEIVIFKIEYNYKQMNLIVS